MKRRAEPAAPPRWTVRDQPPFLEAYPVLRIGEAHRARLAGHTHILWRDHRGLVVGAGEACWEDRARLSVRFSIDDADHRWAQRGEASFTIAWKGSLEDNKRPFAECPRCLRHIDVLVLNGMWQCAPCHQLRNRTSQLTEAARYTEQLTAVEGAVATSDLSAHQRRKLEAERARLDAKLGGQRLSTNALYRAVIIAEWLTPLSVAQ